MKKYLFKATLFIATFILVSCSSDNNEPPKPDPTFSAEGVYILNEGTFTGNNSSLSYYNKETKEITADVFKTQNGTPIGGGGQDILVYGTKMYITATTSNNVYVTDLKAKLLTYEDGSVTTINLSKKEETKDVLDPRNFTFHEGKVYVNYYSGHIAKIDTTTMKVEKIISDNYKTLEGITTFGNKLYTVESTMYGSTPTKRVAIVNLTNFEFETPIEVAQNPDRILSDQLGNLFTLSKSYDDKGNTTTTFTQIKPNGTKKELTIAAGEMAMLDNKILLLTRGYLETKTSFTYYDIYTEKIGDTPFIPITDDKIAKQLENAYTLSIDPTSKDIYISTTDYTTDGGSQMFVFSKTGQYQTHFATKGLSPRKAAFITKQTN